MKNYIGALYATSYDWSHTTPMGEFLRPLYTQYNRNPEKSAIAKAFADGLNFGFNMGLGASVAMSGYNQRFSPCPDVSRSIIAKNIRFSQDSISSRFSDGTSVNDMIRGLKSGTIKPNDVPAIRIMQKDGVMYTLDNRRLYAFQQAGIDNISYRMATQQEIAREAWKFTTQNNGTSIRVRGE